MTHASWNNEHGEPAGPGHDNERLEYLGDAVLELVVGEYLFRRFPTYDEGQLTQLRAALVNTTSLARLGERLELGETLLMGRGAVKTGARKLPSLLANAFEAMIGAIFLDQGYRAATKVFLQNIGDLAEWSDENFKGQLQQASQDRTGDTPHYRVIATGGPGHKREYTAEVLLGERVGGTGRGPTKQAAEQAAAHDALDKLTKTGRGGAAAAVGAARDAAKTVASEPARVRRRVAEVAADRGATPRRRRGRSGASPPTCRPPRRPVGTEAQPEPALRAASRRRGAGRAPARRAAATRGGGTAPRRRRGRRGGRGRGGGSTPPVTGVSTRSWGREIPAAQDVDVPRSARGQSAR